MVAGGFGAEAGQVAKRVKRQHRHREVLPAEIGKGIEAQGDDTMARALAREHQRAATAADDRLEPWMLAEIFAVVQIEQAKIHRVGESAGRRPSGDHDA